MFNKFAIILFVFIISINSNANSGTGKILVKSAKLIKLEIFDQLNVIGQCKNEQSQTYYANISGIIEIMHNEQGNKVKKNDLIIAIDRDLAESSYYDASVTLKSAESAYLRDRVLFEKKHLSKELLEKSEVNLTKSKCEFEKASNTYSDRMVRVPFDGEIGVVKVKTGDRVKEGEYLFSIIATSNKNIFLEVPEIFYGKIDKNTKILIRDSNGSKINSNIVSISNYISDHGTIDIKLMINDKNNLVHGSYVNATIIINKHLGLMIPELSVLKNDVGNFVYKIDKDNIIKQIYVKLGSRTDKFIELISDDISEGDFIVTEGLTKVHDGVIVETLG